MFKKIILATAIILVVSSLVFIALTQPITYEIKLDPVIENADASNQKQRPFIVDREEYPFKSHWFERDGVSMHYVDKGEGIPIVLTHGNPDWSFLNRKIVKEMSGEARLIAYDLPGFGFSDTPENYNFTPQEHVEWISTLIFEHLKLDKFIIVVQDWGGPTGLSIATTHPESIYGVVISNTWAWEVEGDFKIFSYLMRTPIMERLIINRNYFAADLLPQHINETSANNKAVTDAYAMAFPTPESRRGTLEFPQQVTIAASWLKELEGRLHTLSDKPVEFIFGLKDLTVGSPENREKWRSHFPDANIQLLPDADHFTQEDNPESFAIALRRILRQIESK